MAHLDWTAERQHVPLPNWLDVVRAECLDGYLAAGGAAVRFVSGTDELLAAARKELLTDAESHGFHTASLDAAALTQEGRRPDLHRIDRFFFEVTAAVDWRQWVQTQARDFLAEIGLPIPPERSLHELREIAAENGRDPQDVIGEYQSRIATRQIKDRLMEYEFRAAVTALGRAQLIPDAVTPTTEEVLLAWFRGTTMPGAAAALKRIHIFQRINPTNARHMLRSFCRWLPSVGRHGLVVVLDLRPYETKNRGQAQRLARFRQQVAEAVYGGASPADLRRLVEEDERAPVVTYSDQAYRTMLALLRRFIDEIDSFERFLLVVLTSPAFYDSAAPRNYYDYDALQTRIGLEVRDAHRPNPSAALVHLGAAQ